MMTENTKLSPGQCFRPEEEKLIGYLKQKAEGKKMSTVFVAERNLYGGDPWHVLNDINQDLWTLHDESSYKKKMIYVVTKVSKNADRNTTKRSVGHGTWDGQTQLYPMKNKHGMIIGHRKMLTYAVDPDLEYFAAGRGYYYLHEMTLSEESLREIGLESTDYVMCRVIWDKSKPCMVNGKKKQGRKFKKTRDHEEQHGEIGNASQMAQQQEFSLPEQIYGGSNITPQDMFHQGNHGETGQAFQHMFDHPNVIENQGANNLSEAAQHEFSHPQEDYYQGDLCVEDYMVEDETQQNSFGDPNVVQSGIYQTETTSSQENGELGESNQHALLDDPFQDFDHLEDFNIEEMLSFLDQ